VLLAQLAGLLLAGHLQGAGQQAAHGGDADVFHLGQVHVQAGPLLAPVLADNDFSPALGQFLDALEIFSGRFACSHDASMQRDTFLSPDKILP
jgi:hypothetical protein